jgi:hypothetical protein
MISEQIAKRHLKTSAELQHLNCSCDGCAKHLATTINDTVEDELKARGEMKAKEEAAAAKIKAEAEAAKQVAPEVIETKIEEAVVAE